MIKKLSIFFALIFTVTALQIAASAESEFELVADMIASYNGSSETVVIPSVIDGINIEGIAEGAFSGNTAVKHVILEDGIVAIQSRAFENCVNLISVDCPETMLFVGVDAFLGCDSFCELNAPENIEYDFTAPPVGFSLMSEEDYTFSSGTITAYSGTDENVVIPSEIGGVTVTKIGTNAFLGNTTMKSVTIPDTVTTIQDYAFKNCKALTEINFSSNLNSAGKEIFSGCTALTSVTVPGSLVKLGNKMFYGCSKLKTVVLSEGVQDTNDYSFCNCSKLQSITFPSTMKKINTWSLGYCEILENVTIPNGVNTIGDAAFYYCNKLNHVVLPNTVTYMGNHAFRGCWELDDLTLSNNITTIWVRCFHHCAFSQLTIPESVTNIQKEAFWMCDKLTELEIPRTVTTIGSQCFYDCTSLKKLIAYNVTSIGANLFQIQATGKENKKVVLYVPEGSKLYNYAVNNGVSYKPIVWSAVSVWDNESVGTVSEINYPYANRVSEFGVNYIPEILKDNAAADEVNISYSMDNLEIPRFEENTYMTVISGVPDTAKDWYFLGTPYIKLRDGSTILGATKRFKIGSHVVQKEE